ncbi:UNVERIFIED_ORG: hypothetical protein JN05_02331 [Zoogloea ramigera]|uniref:Phage holin family protein n=1 Tax=Duganella zoogloeoides TaxID=75659 RepID=A0ABZ0Y5I0_9BURK|nr:hypothetical protein [Duganella zoogloeoides]WQH06560.1 hypothetical protein SR858_09610 [Duganella zoogloeoides]
MPVPDIIPFSAGALVQIMALPVAAGAAATALTFLFMWPRTRREALVRLTCSICTAALLGPLLLVALHSWWPTLFDSAKVLAVLYGAPSILGVVAVACPVLVLAGLPAWWGLGAVVLWLERRRGKDIGELVHDAAEVVREVRRG